MKWLLALILATALFAACGGGDNGSGLPIPGSSSAKQADTEQGLKDAVKTLSIAVEKGDTQGSYQGWAKACRDKVGVAEWGSTLKLASSFYESFTGLKLADDKVEDVLVRNFSPQKAEAASVTTNKGQKTESDPKYAPFAYEDGRWVETDCDSMKFSFGNSSSPTAGK